MCFISGWGWWKLPAPCYQVSANLQREAGCSEVYSVPAEDAGEPQQEGRGGKQVDLEQQNEMSSLLQGVKAMVRLFKENTEFYNNAITSIAAMYTGAPGDEEWSGIGPFTVEEYCQ